MVDVDAYGESTSEDVGGFDDESVGADANAQAEALATASVHGLGGYDVSFDPTTDAGVPTIADYDIETFKEYPQLNPYYDPLYTPSFKIGRDILVQGLTDKGQDVIDAREEEQGLTTIGGDTPQDNRWDFINPPVVQPPVQPVQPVAPTTSYEDSVLFNFTPRERRNYLLNQIEMGMDPTRGYTGPDGVYVDFTAIYPDIFYPDQVFTQPMLRGGGYVDDYRMNRGGIMNIRDEEGRVIGVQDDAADEMNRIRYHSGRDARDERFRVAARERDAREEMDRLRREARYEDVHGRGLRTFGHGGGVGSLASVARNMFRKRRLPRAGMVM
jgi:hypothetical protein